MCSAKLNTLLMRWKLYSIQNDVILFRALYFRPQNTFFGEYRFVRQFSRRFYLHSPLSNILTCRFNAGNPILYFSLQGFNTSVN